MPAAATRIEIPRWVQLSGLPVLVLSFTAVMIVAAGVPATAAYLTTGRGRQQTRAGAAG